VADTGQPGRRVGFEAVDDEDSSTASRRRAMADIINVEGCAPEIVVRDNGSRDVFRKVVRFIASDWRRGRRIDRNVNSEKAAACCFAAMFGRPF